MNPAPPVTILDFSRPEREDVKSPTRPTVSKRHRGLNWLGKKISRCFLALHTKRNTGEKIMLQQRTFFFGTKPEGTPKKDGENPLVPERRFRAMSPDSIEIRFTNNAVTQFGGYPLWNQFCRTVG